VTLLEVQNLTKRFGKKTVLNRVSLEVRSGEILGLIGPNGAGKTTLFECVAGLLPVDGGRFSVVSPQLAATKQTAALTEEDNQKKVKDAATAALWSLTPELRKEVLFYMPDAIRPWPEQSVSRVVQVFEELYPASAGRGQEILQELKLEALQPRRVAALSKGEAKRLLLALALLTPHPLLLLDEPFDGLDLRQAHHVMQLLRSVASKGRTLFLSIHQLNDAARVCDRLVLLSDGEIVGHGTVDELMARAGLKSGGLEEVFLALT
jgi:ABC-2 type transport system ATP-binding protein